MIQRGLQGRIIEHYGFVPQSMTLVDGNWFDGGKVIIKV